MNEAARPVTLTPHKRTENGIIRPISITPILQKLHLLPVAPPIEYKSLRQRVKQCMGLVRNTYVNL